jgi:hypothetical protein
MPGLPNRLYNETVLQQEFSSPASGLTSAVKSNASDPLPSQGAFLKPRD